MFGKTGKDQIAGALGMFTKAILELKNGVKATEKENEQIEKDVSKRLNAFKVFEDEMSVKTSSNSESISKATKVIGNIESLLEVGGE